MDDYLKLIEKLRKIEALHAGATTKGERVAAEEAHKRIWERLAQAPIPEPPREYRFSLENLWSRKLFVALLRRDGHRPYRYRRQRYTTVMVRLPASEAEALWAEFGALDEALRSHLDDLAERVISGAVSPDTGEADELPMLETE